MSYLEYYQLSNEPFSNAPVARLYYDSEQHSQALMRLQHAAKQMKGLALLIGNIGAGKTTLARRMLDSLPEDEYEAALLVIIHSGITSNWLIKRIALQLGIREPAADKLTLLSQLYKRLLEIHHQGRKAVVLIDEAQMLNSRELMEEFRGMLNLEIPNSKLVTFIFFGLPEIEDNLKLDPPLLQRVAMRCRLDSLNEESTHKYVNHRLRLAGSRRQLFSPTAINYIHRYSNGTPRVINTICDNALFEGFLSKKQIIDGNVIRVVARELSLTTTAVQTEVTNTTQIEDVDLLNTNRHAAVVVKRTVPPEPIVKVEVPSENLNFTIDISDEATDGGTGAISDPAVEKTASAKPPVATKPAKTDQDYEEVFERIANEDLEDIDSILSGLVESK